MVNTSGVRDDLLFPQTGVDDEAAARAPPRPGQLADSLTRQSRFSLSSSRR